MTEKNHKDYAIGLCEIGNCQSCFFACICHHCAIANARENLDGSPFCFNLCCVSAPVTRWITRTAYGIPDKGCIDDFIVPCLCAPCSANQLYQTSREYGRVASTAGREANQNEWKKKLSIYNLEFGLCCYTFFCNPCAVGSALNDSTGMPFCMGCCCATSCAARNIARYQYRLASATGNETWDECFMPALLSVCVWPQLAALMELLQEVKERGGGENGRYIYGYDPSKDVSPMRSSTQGAVTVGAMHAKTQGSVQTY